MVKTLIKLVIVFVIGAVGGIFAVKITREGQSPGIPKPVVERKEVTIEENKALTNAIEKVDKTVVGIRAKKKNSFVTGSGLILTSDGLVVALSNLLPRGANIEVFYRGEKVGYKILKRDLKENLGLLKLDKNNLSTTSFADLKKLKLGQRVFLVGFKVSKTGQITEVVDEGIIKSLQGDDIRVNIPLAKDIEGSPLFDIEGNIIGIANLTAKEGGTIIPISKIKEFVNL